MFDHIGEATRKKQPQRLQVCLFIFFANSPPGAKILVARLASRAGIPTRGFPPSERHRSSGGVIYQPVRDVGISLRRHQALLFGLLCSTPICRCGNSASRRRNLPGRVCCGSAPFSQALCQAACSCLLACSSWRARRDRRATAELPPSNPGARSIGSGNVLRRLHRFYDSEGCLFTRRPPKVCVIT